MTANLAGYLNLDCLWMSLQSHISTTKRRPEWSDARNRLVEYYLPEADAAAKAVYGEYRCRDANTLDDLQSVAALKLIQIIEYLGKYPKLASVGAIGFWLKEACRRYLRRERSRRHERLDAVPNRLLARCDTPAPATVRKPKGIVYTVLYQLAVEGRSKVKVARAVGKSRSWIGDLEQRALEWMKDHDSLEGFEE